MIEMSTVCPIYDDVENKRASASHENLDQDAPHPFWHGVACCTTPPYLEILKSHTLFSQQKKTFVEEKKKNHFTLVFKLYAIDSHGVQVMSTWNYLEINFPFLSFFTGLVRCW